MADRFSIHHITHYLRQMGVKFDPKEILTEVMNTPTRIGSNSAGDRDKPCPYVILPKRGINFTVYGATARHGVL